MRFTPGKIRRRLEKSARQVGVGRTVGRCFALPFTTVGWKIIGSTAFEREQRRAGKAYDAEHRVETERNRDTEWAADIDSEHWGQGTGYHPSPPDAVRRAIRSLDIDHRAYTFADVGSGKCRVPLVASEFPFKACLGIEYDPQLHAIAERNIAAYRGDNQRCVAVRSHCADATTFDLPLTPLVLFFHDPFGEPVLTKFLDHLKDSLRDHPRDVRVIEYDPVYRELLAAAGFRETGGEDADREGFLPAVVYKLDWFNRNTFRNRLGQEYLTYRLHTNGSTP